MKFSVVLLVALLASGVALAAVTPAARATKTTVATKTKVDRKTGTTSVAKTTTVSTADKVWVTKSSKVLHGSNSKRYGKTKGECMARAEGKGYRLDKSERCGK